MFFLDELGSGFAPAAAPLITLDHGVDAGRGAGGLLAAFYGLALLVEPSLLRWSERFRVRRWLVAWLAALGAVLLGAALTQSYWLLLVVLALYGPVSGAVTSVAEGTLVEATPDARERTMSRIMLAGGLGDLAVPAVLAALATLGGGWRGAHALAAAVAVVLAVGLWHARSLDRRVASADDDEDEAPDPPRLRDAARDPRVAGWVLASAATNLMDEVMSAFTAVHVYAHVTRDPAELAVAAGAWIAGGLAGVAILERALARAAPVAPMRALLVTGALGLAAFAALLAARDLAWACVALAVLGAAVSTYYPIVHARAYAALPGHPGVVNGLVAVCSPLELAAPLALGLLVDRAGSASALAVLALVPAAMVVVALRAKDGR
ncbi:MAG: MFS transporter [Sandaracinaceae bacterium]|nr:MFS transporter [Sandaracinaceae bacterium]